MEIAARLLVRERSQLAMHRQPLAQCRDRGVGQARFEGTGTNEHHLEWPRRPAVHEQAEFVEQVRREPVRVLDHQHWDAIAGRFRAERLPEDGEELWLARG